MEKLEIVPYRPQWPETFRVAQKFYLDCLSNFEVRIDHIGSTSVEGLCSKDCVDLQVTLSSEEDFDGVSKALGEVGEAPPNRRRDHVPPGMDPDPSFWVKMFQKNRAFASPLNVHFRILGRPNQVYPLLFRDYLRAHPRAAQAYGAFKQKFAAAFPESRDLYTDIKDPVCDLIYLEAEKWRDSLSG